MKKIMDIKNSISKSKNKIFKKISEKSFFNFLLKKQDPTIFDVGANKGQTIQYFKKIFKSPKIYAFEPSNDTFNILKKKFKRTKGIILNQVALDYKKGRRKFYYHKFESKNTSGLSGFYKINKHSKDSINLKNKFFKRKMIRNINYNYYVKTQTVDHFFSEYNLESIDILKIDTQGNEKNILLGAVKSLNKIKFIKLELMFFDFYEKNLSFYEIEKILRKSNFELFNIFEINNNSMNYRTDWVEVIYKNNNYK